MSPENRAGLGAHSIYLEESLTLEGGVKVKIFPVDVPPAAWLNQPIYSSRPFETVAIKNLSSGLSSDVWASQYVEVKDRAFGILVWPTLQTGVSHVNVAREGGKKSGDLRQADVTVAIVNSAAKHDLASASSASLLVVDEVHRYGAGTFSYALRDTYEHRLGLTATLERSGDDAVE